MTTQTINALKALRDGETVEVEGCLFVIDGDGRPRSQGDWYIGQRNVGPQLLTVKSFSFYRGSQDETVRVDTFDGDEWPSWINPQETAYAYNYGECVKVRLAAGAELA